MIYNVASQVPGSSTISTRFVTADTFDNNGLLTIFSVHDVKLGQLNSVAAVPTANILSIIPVSQ